MEDDCGSDWRGIDRYQPLLRSSPGERGKEQRSAYSYDSGGYDSSRFDSSRYGPRRHRTGRAASGKTALENATSQRGCGA
jgi:hypothetical protein